MADKCGNCDCADRSQCTQKKGNQYGFVIAETEYSEFMMTEGPKDGCKCGSNCRCIDCKCGPH